MNFEKDILLSSKVLSAFYKDSIGGLKPVINQRPLNHIIQALELEHYTQEGGLLDAGFTNFLSTYLSFNTRLHHPGYLGHQCAAPHYSAALGALVNGFTNNVAAIYEMGPASAAIEYYLINWMLEKIGWVKAPLSQEERLRSEGHGGGVLVDGGSLANLTALVIARTEHHPDVWSKGNKAGISILLPSESHYSLMKSAGILGIGSEAIYLLDVDRRGAILPDRLPASLRKANNEGRKPIALVANACSTPVGIYDPLDELADFCQESDLWFHVDGAHGASALLSQKYRHLLKGVQRADSLVWDAHKLLQTPSLCAALLVKDHRTIDHGMHVGDKASYLFHDKEQPGFDFIHRTLETTKSGLGEKLFFVLGTLGEKGLTAFIEQQYELTQEVYDYLMGLPDFECPVKPQSNILCFRYLGKDQDQLQLRQGIIESADFYLTSTLFNGERYLRLVFMNGQTTLKDIKTLVSRIRAISEKTKYRIS